MNIEIDIAVRGAPPAVELAIREVINNAVRQLAEGSGGTFQSILVDTETGREIADPVDLSKLS